MADDEPLDVWDEWGGHLGVERRDVVHRDGLWHVGFHLWVVSGGEVLLQRRSPRKDTHPGMLDATAAGHVGAGEDAVAGGLREAAEELGVTYEAKQLVELGVRAVTDRVGEGGRLLNREFQHVHAVLDPRPLDAWTGFDRDEVDGLVALGLADLGALAGGEGAGPWPARAWDGVHVTRAEVTREEVIPGAYLPVLAIMLERLARGERPLAI